MRRAVAAVPGVTHAARGVARARGGPPDGQQVTGLAVDPAQLRGAVSRPRRPSRRSPPAARAAAPAARSRCSPPRRPPPTSASGVGHARQPGGRSQPLRSGSRACCRHARAARRRRVRGHAADALASTATPARGPVNELLLTGANIDSARLATVVQHAASCGQSRAIRSDILNGLTEAPLQHGAFVLFELVRRRGRGARARGHAARARARGGRTGDDARPAGHDGPRARDSGRGWWRSRCCPRCSRRRSRRGRARSCCPGWSRRRSTCRCSPGRRASVALAPDVASFALPLAGLVVAAFLALGVEIRTDRRHGVAGSLRVGE